MTNGAAFGYAILKYVASHYGFALQLLSTDRDCQTQYSLAQTGRGSWPRSFHIGGNAFDARIEPYSAASQASIGAWGEAIGLRWGGRFSSPDPNHFDLGNYVEPGDCSTYRQYSVDLGGLRSEFAGSGAPVSISGAASAPAGSGGPVRTAYPLAEERRETPKGQQPTNWGCFPDEVQGPGGLCYPDPARYPCEYWVCR